MKNKISIALTTYNGELYIKQELDSIIPQLENNDEIIISDDGSTDNTLNIIKSYNDPRIKLYQGPKQGIKKNFENAIKKCNGDIIFLADQDDVWLENKLNVIKKEFEDNPDLSLIVHDNYMVDTNLNKICDSFFKFRNVKSGLINNLIKNSFIGCCMAFKKNVVKDILPIPEHSPMHDQWIGLEVTIKGKVKFIDDKLILYRRHDNNNSCFKRNNIFVMIKNRIYLVHHLILRNIFKRK